MSIKVESTTDTPEQVTAATGSKTVTAETSAPPTEESETPEASETLEKPDEETTESDEESEESGEEKPKKKSGFKKRIEKLNKRLSEKDQLIEHWKQAALKQTPAAEPSKDAQPTVSNEGRPLADSFDSHEDYLEALVDWKAEKKFQERESKESQAKLRSEQEAQVTTHGERVRAFKATHDDFDEALESVDDVPMSITVQQVILSSENGPELMYELAKDRKEFERICSLSSIQAAKELGKLEAKIAGTSSGAKTTEVKKTKAPPPINPVGARGSAVAKSLDQADSFEEFKRLREEQLKRR